MEEETNLKHAELPTYTAIEQLEAYPTFTQKSSTIVHCITSAGRVLLINNT